MNRQQYNLDCAVSRLRVALIEAFERATEAEMPPEWVKQVVNEQYEMWRESVEKYWEAPRYSANSHPLRDLVKAQGEVKDAPQEPERPLAVFQDVHIGPDETPRQMRQRIIDRLTEQPEGEFPFRPAADDE